MTARTRSTKMQPRVAWRAIRKLIADPEDTAQVFTIVRAMSGPSLRNGYRRFQASPWGRRVLDEDMDLLATLRDRAALRSQPPGSLAAAYLAFVERENLSADGLVEASVSDEERWDDPGIERYGKRLRDQHDLWHALTRYGRDELGELCLLAFTYAQTRNRGIGLIVLVGAYKLRKALGKGVVRAALRGYRDGRRARWLPEQPWELLLQEPVDAVREQLGIPEPVPYRALRHQLATAASTTA